MEDVWLVAENSITSLGFSVNEQLEKIRSGQTGIQKIENTDFSPFPFFGSLVDSNNLEAQFARLGDAAAFTRLEKLMICSIHACLKGMPFDLKDPDTLLILTTTKGNIDMLEKGKYPLFQENRAYLSILGRVICEFFSAFNPPLIICNACISGVMGIITGSRYIRKGNFKHVVVCGGDIISSFTVAGFQSFKAIGSSPCKPFDASRDGLSLGEGAGTLVLSRDRVGGSRIRLAGGAVSNDANHISGPSRTGEGLYAAIQIALKESNLLPDDVGFVSSHGTATPYNDEMECIAFNRSGFQHTPINSYKGAIGHTLGAAGVIESVFAMDVFKTKRLMPSTGFKNLGVTLPLNVICSVEEKYIHALLKTASGFGGGNAALLMTQSDE